MSGLEKILKDAEICRSPGTPEETLETAGCTGGCEVYDKDGLPDCGRCSQGKVEDNANGKHSEDCSCIDCYNRKSKLCGVGG